MSYTSYGSKILTSSSNLSNKDSDIIGVDFSSNWEGKAYSSQMKHRQDISNGLGKTVEQMKILATVLNDIDQYDNFVYQRDKWEKEYNNTPIDDKDKRSMALNNFNEAKRRIAQKRTEINNALAGISSTYTSSLEMISATEVEITNDIFGKVFMSSSNIEKAFGVEQYVSYANFNENPNFNNYEAWVSENPYSQCGLYGQCTWFAWGKFYEMYGYDPGFRGNGNMCAYQLANSHPDLFEISNYPVTGAVFSYQGYPYGHVGIITEVKDGMLTYQDGNYDGVTNSFEVAKTDWGMKTMSVDDFINRYGGKVVFANPTSRSDSEAVVV